MYELPYLALPSKANGLYNIEFPEVNIFLLI